MKNYLVYAFVATCLLGLHTLPLRADGPTVSTRVLLYSQSPEKYAWTAIFIQNNAVLGLYCPPPVNETPAPSTPEEMAQYISTECHPVPSHFPHENIFQKNGGRFIVTVQLPASASDKTDMGKEGFVTGAQTTTVDPNAPSTAIMTYAFISHRAHENPEIVSDRKTLILESDVTIDMKPFSEPTQAYPRATPSSYPSFGPNPHPSSAPLTYPSSLPSSHPSYAPDHS